MTDTDQRIILIGVAVTDTSEETDEFRVVLVTAHPSVVILIVDKRTVAQVVPQEGSGREVLVTCVESIVLVEEITVAHDTVEAVVTPLGIVARSQFQIFADVVTLALTGRTIPSLTNQ